MSEGGSPRFSVERIKSPTSGDEKDIRRMHSALTPHGLLERVLTGAGHDGSLNELEKMDGVFIAKDEAGKPVAALTVAQGEGGWEITHEQSSVHDEAVFAELVDRAVDFAKPRGASEIMVKASDRGEDMVRALRSRAFSADGPGEIRTYVRHL